MKGVWNRRRFLGTVGLGSVAPWILPSSARGASKWVSPSNRITLGLIGCGSHGAGWNLDQVFRHPDAQVLAVCDVDRERALQARGKVERFYEEKWGRRVRCDIYSDFREMIRRPDLDAIMNCTPDHWHVLPALMAARSGKDVLCEKPLTLTVEEGIRLRSVVEETGCVFQTASENRSIDSYLRLCELVRNGRIGRLKHIRVSLPAGNESRGDNFESRTVAPVPEGFDYEMWLGQAPRAPYIPARCHGSFRWIRDYSGGRLTDWGAHLIDLAQWAHDSEDSGPVEVSGKGKFPPEDSLFDTAYEFDLLYRYADGVTLRVVSEGPGIRFEGSDGWIGFEGWRSPLEASRPEILEEPLPAEAEWLYRPSEVVARDANWRGGEHRNFLDGVKSRKPCYAPVETGHRTITIAHIGNICLLLGRKLRWNPETERFLDDSSADRLLAREQRKPWTFESVDDWVAS